MSKQCIKNGCSNPVFSSNYCRIHQWLRTDDKYKKQKEYAKQNRKSKKPLNKESVKQQKVTKRYLERLKDFWENAVNTGTNRCFFCNEYMDKRENIHHLLGRGSIVLDEQWWVLCHQLCHSLYHSSTVEQLMREPWYEEWMARLEKKDTTAYFIELNKRQKNIELFD